MFKITILRTPPPNNPQRRGEDFVAPEGYYFKTSHLVGAGEIAVIWEGRQTPPSLVKLCNELVRQHFDSPNSTTPIVAAISDELEARGLTELA